MKKLSALLVVGLLFAGFLPAFAGEPAPPVVPGEEKKDMGRPPLPEGVPNVFDPEIRAQYHPVGVANLRGNPDFPVLILQNAVGGQPQVILLGLDARNGKETWSLKSDPVILIVLFANQETILEAYMDAGFADSGKPSRVFRKLDQLPPNEFWNPNNKGPSFTYM